MFFFFRTSGQAVGPSGCRCSFPGIKRPVREVTHLPPSGAEIKNRWSCMPVLFPPICFHDVDKEKSDWVRLGKTSVGGHCEAFRDVDADARF